MTSLTSNQTPVGHAASANDQAFASRETSRHPQEATQAERERAVSAVLREVETITSQHGVTRTALALISAQLLALAERTELFSRDDFPPPAAASGDTSTRYRLNPGSDGIALYLNSLLPGKTTIPHNHDTWAVIAAIEGEELNRVYRRKDDGSDPDRADIEIERELVVRAGVPIAFLPEDIHSIHVTGQHPTLHFHLYGRPLETLVDRIGVELETGRIVRYNAKHMAQATQAVG